MPARRLRETICAAVFMSVFICGSANAASLITSDVGYTGPVFDMGSYADNYYTYTAGPITFPKGITYTSTTTNSVVGKGGYGLGDNGTSTNGIVGTNSGSATITLSFSSPVSSFGGFFNYSLQSGTPDGADPIITALNSSGGIIASYDLFTTAPISTPGATDAYEFRGISDTSADIAFFQLSGGYIILEGQMGMSAVPLPASAPMLGAALVALGAVGYGMKRKAKAAA